MELLSRWERRLEKQLSVWKHVAVNVLCRRRRQEADVERVRSMRTIYVERNSYSCELGDVSHSVKGAIPQQVFT